MIEFHGNTHFQQAQSLKAKLLWGLVIGGAIAGMVYLTTVTIARYLQSPTSVSINFVTENGLSLPDVLLCSSQVFDKAKIKVHNISQAHVSYLQDYFFWNSNTNGGFQNENRIFLNRYDHESINRDLFSGEVDELEDLVLNLSENCSNFLLYCRLGDQFNCCDKATSIFHNVFGQCFALKNLSEIGVQTFPGYTSGFTVLTAMRKPTVRNTSLKPTTYVEISDKFVFPTNTPVPLVTENSNYFELIMTRSVLSPKRLGGCLDDSDTSAKLCRSVSWADAVERLCNCTEFGYLTHNQMAFTNKSKYVCKPYEAVRCYKTSNVMIEEEYNANVLRSCSKPNCFQVDFRYTLTVAEIDQTWSREQRNETDPTVVLTKLSMYYQELSYLSYTEFHTMTFDSVLSSVGGNIGLFLGASIVSVVQLSTSVLLNLKLFIDKLRNVQL